MGRHAGVDYRLPDIRNRRIQEEIAEGLEARLRAGEIDGAARDEAVRIIRKAVRLLLARKRLSAAERVRLLARWGEYVA